MGLATAGTEVPVNRCGGSFAEVSAHTGNEGQRGPQVGTQEHAGRTREVAGRRDHAGRTWEVAGRRDHAGRTWELAGRRDHAGDTKEARAWADGEVVHDQQTLVPGDDHTLQVEAQGARSQAQLGHIRAEHADTQVQVARRRSCAVRADDAEPGQARVGVGPYEDGSEAHSLHTVSVRNCQSKEEVHRALVG